MSGAAALRLSVCRSLRGFGGSALLAAAWVVAPGVSAQPASAQNAPLPPLGRFVLDGAANQGGLMLGTAPPGATSLALDGKPLAMAADRRFVIAFDRDAGPAATLTATMADGRIVTQALTVAPRAWRIERLDRVAKYPVPDADFQRRRPAELAQIAAARAMVTEANGWRQKIVWPVTGRISGLFGAQRIYRGEPGGYHSGVDVARATGTAVAAPADGVVVLAAATPFTLEGHLLIIDHGMGLNSAFLHLSRIDVAVGARVQQGQTVGAIGATGRASGPHLHWAMKWRDARIDPLLIAGPMVAAQ